VRAVVASPGASGLPEFAGNTWAFLQYFLGLDRLGVEAVWVDHQPKLDPRRPARDDRAWPAEDCHSIEYASARFDAMARKFGFEDRYCILYDGGAASFGLTLRELDEAIAEADALLNIGGPLPADSPLMRIPRRAYIDLDPGFTQIWAHQTDLGLERHDFFFTVGQNVGREDFAIATGGLAWRRIFPPVVLDLWPAEFDASSERLTTIADWRGSQYARFEGELYAGKREEFLRFLEVPSRIGRAIEPALNIGQHDHEDLGVLLRSGWLVRDPYLYAGDLESYGEFIRSSRAEFSVAKSGYVKLRCGWFSDRTGTYLASGKPAVVQSTGFEWCLPPGEGLLTFKSVEDAIAALDAIERDYAGHSQAARRIAEENLDAHVVLGSILDQMGIDRERRIR
jgi:hypothetical protein